MYREQNAIFWTVRRFQEFLPTITLKSEIKYNTTLSVSLQFSDQYAQITAKKCIEVQSGEKLARKRQQDCLKRFVANES